MTRAEDGQETPSGTSRRRAPRGPSAKARLRRMARKGSERIVAPPGFGGTEAVRRFGDMLADALLALEGLHALPTWWPVDRLAAFRDAPGRSLADRLAGFLGVSLGGLAICSTDSCDAALVRSVAGFLGCAAATRAPWDTGHPSFSGEALVWSGVPVLLLGSRSGAVHVVAPAEVPR